MVFHSVTHDQQLLLREPLTQISVGHQYLARIDMMLLAVDTQAKVMIGRYRVGHLLVGTMLAG